MTTQTPEKTQEQIALNGGAPSVIRDAPRPPRWGQPELNQLEVMLGQDALFYWNGPQTKLLTERFQEHYPLQYVMPCSSGTAALHIAVAAAGVGPGDEVITSAITDMGTVIGILYQQGVPVFADLVGDTYALDPADVRRKITPRTKAIIAVHLTGLPCQLDELKAIADEHNLVLIEDCAQAWGALYRGKPIGTVGHIGCYSLNDFKHIACGDGGIVASNDERFGPLLQRFGDKDYDRTSGVRAPATLAPNYRISEPQSAIAAVQMLSMWDLTAARAEVGLVLNEELADVPGIITQNAHPDDRWTCWFYMFRIDPGIISCTNHEFAKALSAEGAHAGAGYTQVPVYKYPMFQNHNFFAGRWPVKELGLTDMDYTTVHCPETEAILDTAVQIGVHEGHSPEWAREIAAAIRKVAAHYSR